MNLEGSVIGNRYKILEKIGNGGMATVYKSLDQILNRYVAIKILREEFTTDEEFIKRFNAEAQAAARLAHHNIVSVFDVGQEYNIYYIVMELIQGKTLKQMIEEDGYLSWKWSINIAIQIASALEVAHKNGIVHRDIKPHNIMITEDGVAKVTDFGIAKAVSNSTITAFGTTLGSVHYFSPEHARGGYTDSKSDLYSLGVVMYEMVTGKVPFDADTPVSVALKHMQESPVEPIKINKDIPYAVNQVIMKAMRKDPNDRYQNASEMIKDLNLALKRPQGGFVEDNAMEESFTKRIPTLGYTEGDEEVHSRRSKVEKVEKKEGFFKQHPKAKGGIVAFVFILVFVATIFITLSLFNSSRPKDIQIPNVVGVDSQLAIQTLENSKLKLNITKEEYSSEYEAGVIISQDPKYINNYKVKEGSTVNVVVSKGIKIEKMIKVVGMKFDEAETALKGLGFKVEKVEEVSKTIQEGVVISQEIEEGTDAAVGSVVKIHVSSGNGLKKITLSSYVGKNTDEVKKELTEQGLEVNIVEEENTVKPDGTVLKQNIDAGTVVEEGSAITLTVNKIQQIKKGTLNIDVKSLVANTSGITDESETVNKSSSPGGATTAKNITVIVKVGGDNVFRQSVSRNTEKLTVTVEGKGVISPKIYLSSEEGVEILAKTVSIDLNSENPVVNVK